MGSRTVSGPCSQVAKTVRSMLHFSTWPGYPMVGSKTFLLSLAFFSGSVIGTNSLRAVLQHVCVVPSQPQRLCHVLWGIWMCPRAVPGGTVSGVCMWHRELYLIFQHCFIQIILRSCLGRYLSVTRGKHQRILIVEHYGQLLAQHPRQPCGSVSVEFLGVWDAATSSATRHLVLSGHSKVGEFGWNSWCTVRTEEGNFSRLVVRTSAK